MDESCKDIVFPENFLWGTAASAHQIEGDNTKNQWWRWEEESSRIADGTKSRRACWHYKLFERDLDLVEILGLGCHRFSIEWSRIEPEPGVLDEEAIDHYRAVLSGMRERELTAFVTLHHFTLPQWFEDGGGWLNPEAPDRFAAFARIIAEKLGQNIEYYITINEPMVVANASYLVGAHPPGHSSEQEFNKVAVNLLYSHAKAARAIRESGTAGEKAKIGVVKSLTVYEAVDPNNAEDVEEKERRHKQLNQWFLDSLSTGRVLEPLGTNEPVPGLKESCDFIGINYYLRARVSPNHERMRQHYENMRGRTEQSDLGWEVYPEGIRQAVELAAGLQVPIFVTANGIADRSDHKRAKFIVSHLAELHNAIRNGADVRGYMHWTLLDGFEWALGYVPKFGLAAVQPETYKRILKKSASVFKEIAMTNAIPARFIRTYLQPGSAETQADTSSPAHEKPVLEQSPHQEPATQQPFQQEPSQPEPLPSTSEPPQEPPPDENPPDTQAEPPRSW